MKPRTVAIVMDASRAPAFGLMLARLFSAVVNVRRAAHILEVVADIEQTKPSAVYYPADVDQQLLQKLAEEVRANRTGLRFVIIGCRGLTVEDTIAVKRRARAA